MLDRLEKQKTALKGEMQAVLDELAVVKDALAARTTVKKDPELEKSRRDLGRKYQKIAVDLSNVGSEIKKLNRKRDAAENKQATTIARHLVKNHIQWESFFVEAARGYLSGHEFEIVSNMATSRQQTR